MTTGDLHPFTPAQMFVMAQAQLEAGTDPQRLIAVAARWVEKYARLVEEQAAGGALDGRSSIYTGETYAEARDRWDAYRGLLVDHLTMADGGGR